MKDGFFELTTSLDLLRKLEFEYEGLVASPCDTYRAFNFFVTATHIADWLNDGDRKATKAYRESHPILMICDHLACSGKHFRLDNKGHTSVVKTERQEWVGSGWVQKGWVGANLTVSFNDGAEELLGTDTENVQGLAEKVLKFWRNELGDKAT